MERLIDSLGLFMSGILIGSFAKDASLPLFPDESNDGLLVAVSSVFAPLNKSAFPFCNIALILTQTANQYIKNENIPDLIDT